MICTGSSSHDVVRLERSFPYGKSKYLVKSTVYQSLPLSLSLFFFNREKKCLNLLFYAVWVHFFFWKFSAYRMTGMGVTVFSEPLSSFLVTQPLPFMFILCIRIK